MSGGIDFRIVAVVITDTLNGSPSWVVITNDGYATVYDCWIRVPRMVRDWLSVHNDTAHCLPGVTIIGNKV